MAYPLQDRYINLLTDFVFDDQKHEDTILHVVEVKVDYTPGGV